MLSIEVQIPLGVQESPAPLCGTSDEKTKKTEGKQRINDARRCGRRATHARTIGGSRVRIWHGTGDGRESVMPPSPNADIDGRRGLEGVTWSLIRALKIIKEDSIALNHSLVELKIHGGTEELEEWQREEVQYLQTLGKEDNYDILAVADVERLQELNDANRRYNNTLAFFMIATPAKYGTSTIATAPPTTQSYSSELSKTQRLETERWYADKHCQAVLKEVL
ncbi:hypothetical protein B0H34DRAFT_676913 [Crassisporium funariophilum]|nr:hypothetical protein B0H34DRAFT_676913 [Crassisporium funariophilum]